MDNKQSQDVYKNSKTRLICAYLFFDNFIMNSINSEITEMSIIFGDKIYHLNRNLKIDLIYRLIN